jgi:hypothetical protein
MGIQHGLDPRRAEIGPGYDGLRQGPRVGRVTCNALEPAGFKHRIDRVDIGLHMYRPDQPPGALTALRTGRRPAFE